MSVSFNVFKQVALSGLLVVSFPSQLATFKAHIFFLVKCSCKYVVGMALCVITFHHSAEQSAILLFTVNIGVSNRVFLGGCHFTMLSAFARDCHLDSSYLARLKFCWTGRSCLASFSNWAYTVLFSVWWISLNQLPHQTSCLTGSFAVLLQVGAVSIE